MSLALTPEVAGTSNTLAQVLLRLGSREEAEAMFRRPVRDDRPGTRAAREASDAADVGEDPSWLYVDPPAEGD